MVRRVVVEREVDGDLRLIVAGWLAWLVRRERIVSDAKPTRRVRALAELLAAVEAGEDVAIRGNELPGSLKVDHRGRYLLTGNRLIEK